MMMALREEHFIPKFVPKEKHNKSSDKKCDPSHCHAPSSGPWLRRVAMGSAEWG